MINHIVLFKFKDDTTDEQIKDFYKGIIDLENRIYGITSIRFGENNSPENKSKGFSHGFVMQFKDSSCRDIYLWHPEHRRVVDDYILPIKEDVLVFDYEV